MVPKREEGHLITRPVEQIPSFPGECSCGEIPCWMNLEDETLLEIGDERVRLELVVYCSLSCSTLMDKRMRAEQRHGRTRHIHRTVHQMESEQVDNLFFN